MTTLCLMHSSGYRALTPAFELDKTDEGVSRRGIGHEWDETGLRGSGPRQPA